MATNNIKDVTPGIAYLHIEDKYNNFCKDIKVKIPSPYLSFTANDIINGVSSKVLGKYIDIIKQATCKITVLVPNTIDKEKLLEAWETKDVKQASTDINDILSRLSPEQREQVLNHINHLKK